MGVSSSLWPIQSLPTSIEKIEYFCEQNGTAQTNVEGILRVKDLEKKLLEVLDPVHEGDKAFGLHSMVKIQQIY